MKVDETKSREVTSCLGETAKLEVGASTWDETTQSIRLRFDKNGRFDPHSSSEIPAEFFAELVAFGLKNIKLTGDDLWIIQKSWMKKISED